MEHPATGRRGCPPMASVLQLRSRLSNVTFGEVEPQTKVCAGTDMSTVLITDRCEKLLNAHRPEHELFQLPHWEALEKHLDRVNDSAAVIILGGPGLRSNFYPGIYKLARDLDNIKVPIIPMGIGWKSFPGDHATLINYRFTAESMKVLRRIQEGTIYFGCRDYLTQAVLQRNGITNTLVTGDPVWYELGSIGHEMKAPPEVRRIVYTPSQGQHFHLQSIGVMRLLRDMFPDSEIFCSFHRGTEADMFTTGQEAKRLKLLMHEAKNAGLEVVDTSYDLKRIAFYNSCDIHVGYRLHGHLYFLSTRKPSILLHEDGRGRGASEALGVRGIDAFKPTASAGIANRLGNWKLVGAFRRAFGAVKANPRTLDILRGYLAEEVENGFARFSGVGKVIDAHYRVMNRFLSSLPS